MNTKSIVIFLFVLFLSFEVSFAFSDLDVDCQGIEESQNGDVFHYKTVHDLFKLDKTHRYSFNSTDLIKDCGNESQYSIQVLEDGEPIGSGHNVSFFINGVKYNRTTDSDGIATLNINLSPGNYIVFCEYETYKNYNNIMVL